MSARQHARRNERAINGMRSDGGSGAHLYHLATFLPCHSDAPPEVAAYAAWLEAQKSPDRRGKTAMEGRHLRRAVVMRRNGCSVAEIGRSLRFSTGTVNTWLNRLPEELRP